MSIPVLISIIFAICTGFLCLFMYRHLKKVESTYRKALDFNQKSLDQQTSRLNILTRAMPNLQAILSNPQQQNLDGWKSLCLDEARALVWADGGSYWSFHEKEQELTFDTGIGTELEIRNGSSRVKLNQGELGLAAVQRMPMVIGNAKASSSSGLIVPLVVSGQLLGLFRFVRKGDPALNQKDLELISMFVNHVGLGLENQEMIVNREKFYLELVQTLADTVDSRDATSEGQSRRARELARGVARQLEMPQEFTYYLEFAALMHDIGKIAIDDSLLKKPGKLTKEEFEIVKKHPELGHKILAPVTMLAPVAPMVLYHQEWFNGKGYPEGLSGEEIPLGARIVAVLDAWGSMTSDKPWRKALKSEVAIKEIKKGSGTQFDPQVVDAFVETIKSQGYLVEK